MDIFFCLVSYDFVASGYIQMELRTAKERHEHSEIKVAPVVYLSNGSRARSRILYQPNPLPEWGKSWRDFQKEGDWRDALYPIGNGVMQAIEKARLDGLRSNLLERCAQPTGSSLGASSLDF